MLDTLFPRYCIGCHKEGTWLCPDCDSRIIRIKTPACFNCQKLSDRGLCPNCRRTIPLTGVLSAGYYRDPVLKEALHALKYQGVRELAPILGELLYQSIKEHDLLKNCLLVPVPLNRFRQSSRGFNQSELIANYLTSKLSWPINSHLLKRTKMTAPQVELNPLARHDNIKNAFVIGERGDLAGQTIILVDDVITTGATLGECAKILRQSGASKIWAFTIARG